eukprot:3328020-Pyramimonas_sp.AAC.1
MASSVALAAEAREPLSYRSLSWRPRRRSFLLREGALRDVDPPSLLDDAVAIGWASPESGCCTAVQCPGRLRCQYVVGGEAAGWPRRGQRSRRE